jgi:hypothetical protein
MERQRQVVKHVLPNRRVVVAHRVEQGLLVPDHVVVYQVVLQLLLPDFSRLYCRLVL